MIRIQRNSDSSFGWARLESNLAEPATLEEAFARATMCAQLQVLDGYYRVVMDADGAQDNPDAELFAQNYTIL
jgi:hypothetical protein